MIYNEYWQVIDVGLMLEEFVVFKYEDNGVVILEDGFYVLEDKLFDLVEVDKLVCFVCVFMKGWKYVEENFDEVVEIVLDNDVIGVQIEKYQKCMMGEIVKLIVGSNGVLDLVDYECIVVFLLVGGFDLVIIKVLEGVWIYVIIDVVLN